MNKNDNRFKGLDIYIEKEAQITWYRDHYYTDVTCNFCVNEVFGTDLRNDDYRWLEFELDYYPGFGLTPVITVGTDDDRSSVPFEFTEAEQKFMYDMFAKHVKTYCGYNSPEDMAKARYDMPE